jgi:formylglycine-generating enzyme required for sulfatase activity
MRLIPALLVAALPILGAAATDRADGWQTLPGGPFRSLLDLQDESRGSRVEPLDMMASPVTNQQFLGFVRANPEWQRDRAPAVLVEPRYLSHWTGPAELGPRALPNQPVTWVSWFAADAYCRFQGGRLPSWLEWEYAASADETRVDARQDPAWRERILAWYSRPSNVALAAVARQPANLHGIHDLHGLVWEWTEDYSALLVTGDSREQGSPDTLRFCGAGALSTADRENYAVLMRVAMLSSLGGADATANLGFRCARAAR